MKSKKIKRVDSLVTLINTKTQIGEGCSRRVYSHTKKTAIKLPIKDDSFISELSLSDLRYEESPHLAYGIAKELDIREFIAKTSTKETKKMVKEILKRPRLNTWYYLNGINQTLTEIDTWLIASEEVKSYLAPILRYGLTKDGLPFLVMPILETVASLEKSLGQVCKIKDAFGEEREKIDTAIHVLEDEFDEFIVDFEDLTGCKQQWLIEELIGDLHTRNVGKYRNTVRILDYGYQKNSNFELL